MRLVINPSIYQPEGRAPRAAIRLIPGLIQGLITNQISLERLVCYLLTIPKYTCIFLNGHQLWE